MHHFLSIAEYFGTINFMFLFSSAHDNYVNAICRPEDLRRPFEQFGALKDIYLPRDYYTG
jgi:hypothetical protein